MTPPPTIAIVQLSIDILFFHTTLIDAYKIGFLMAEVGKEERTRPDPRRCNYIYSDINKEDHSVKPIVFLGDSLSRIREFPETARPQVGMELRQVQRGLEPSDWKQMKTVGLSVRETRVAKPQAPFEFFTSPILSTQRMCYMLFRRRPGPLQSVTLPWRH
jgi:hypothetical protein